MTDTLGSRGLIGLLVPYFNSVVQPELEALRPAGVTNQTARFALDENVLEDVAGAAEKLATCGVGALVVALSTESFPGGLELLAQGADEVRKRTSLPVATASHAVHEALRAAGAERISVVTPFDDAANEHVRNAFETAGYSVAAIAGAACPDIAKIGHTNLGEIRRLFREADRADAEILVHVGTGLPVTALIDELESTHGKPVVGCNAASYRQALRMCGIEDGLSGAGRLFSAR